MKDPVRMPFEPGADLRVFVGAVVIEDGVHALAGGTFPIDGVEEPDELLMGVLLHTSAGDDAIEDLEGGEQGGPHGHSLGRGRRIARYRVLVNPTPVSAH